MNLNLKKREVEHNGSTFDSFLEEEGIRKEVEAVALKRVSTWRDDKSKKKQPAKRVKEVSPARKGWESHP